MARRALLRAAVHGAILAACASGTAIGEDARSALATRLAQCAAIAVPDARLECYDALAARRTAPAPAPAAASAAVPAPAAAPVPAPIAAPRAEDFGLRAPPPQKDEIKSITRRVTGFGQSAQGRVVVALDNGQSWELDTPDPLLAVGDSVTIQRAALGSFLLTTPTKRTHRIRRIH